MSERRTLRTQGEVIEEYSRDFPAEIVEFFLDPDAVVLDRYQQLAVLVPGAAHQRQRHFEAAILHGVVQQVEQYVRDVHLIHVYV